VVPPSSSSSDVDKESDLLLANALARLGSGQPPQIEALASLQEARERSARAGEAWLRDAEAPREWVGRGPGQSPGVVIEGTAGPADASSPGLSVWRCLGADPLTLAIGDAAVLNRYREQLYVPDVILAPVGVSEQVRALLRMSAPC
jgi:hypothetical protein